MSAGCLHELVRLLSLAHTPGPQMLAAAEQLRLAESQQGFGPALLHLVQSSDTSPDVKQASSIYFKNFIMRCWLAEPGAMAQDDREPLRKMIIQLIMSTHKVLRLQLCAALSEIVATDFPGDWPDLLPELTKILGASGGNPQAQNAAMEAAHAVFAHYRLCSRSSELVRQARCSADAFGPAHLEVWRHACSCILERKDHPVDHVVAYMNLLVTAAQVFHDLNLPALADFFRENRNAYLQGSIALLEYKNAQAFPEGNIDTCPLHNLKVQIFGNLSLYARRYEQQFESFVGPCVKAAWNSVVSQSSEQLTTAGMGLLSDVAATEWTSSPLDDSATLQALCESVILPNIQLKPSDISLFHEDPQEFIRRDLESADQDSPRRAAIDLVRAIRRHYDSKVAELIVVYASRLLEDAKTKPLEQEIICKDACINLVIALAGGVSQKCPPHTAVLENFYTAQVATELHAQPVAERAVLRAACLKYITFLRSHLPATCVMHTLPGILIHVRAESPVVHTYAAHCFSGLIAVKETCNGIRKPRYDHNVLKPIASEIVKVILQILQERRGVPQNEYLVHALVQMCDFLELWSGNDVNTSLPSLGILAEVVGRTSNPNPEYMHDIFECIAIFLRGLAATKNDEASSIILPVLGLIWEQNNEDLLHYSLQIIASLLDATAAECVKPFYLHVFERMMDVKLWRNIGTIPAVIRLLRAYIAKHQVFSELIRGNMQVIFERFQMIINHRKCGSFAFEMLNCIIRYLNFEMYQTCLPTALSLIMTRLQAKKEPQLEKDCSISLFLFVHAHSDPGMLPQVLEHIQRGLFQHVLTKVLLPGACRALLLRRKKICIFGLVKLMRSQEVCENQQILLACVENLTQQVRRTKNGGLLDWLNCFFSAKLEEENQEHPEFEVPFSRLVHADGNPDNLWDPLPEIQDIATGKKAVQAALAPLQAAILSLGEAALPLVEILQADA